MWIILGGICNFEHLQCTKLLVCMCSMVLVKHKLVPHISNQNVVKHFAVLPNSVLLNSIIPVSLRKLRLHALMTTTTGFNGSWTNTIRGAVFLCRCGDRNKRFAFYNQQVDVN